MTKPTGVKTLTENVYVHFLVLLSAVFLFVGKPVPSSNEFSYLLRLKKLYDPSYLAHDITFSTPMNEYWLFDHIFGFPTLFVSIELVGWIGRLSCWSILLLALIKLGKRWELPLWMITTSLFLWLYVGQSLIADEWMFGGFEAKCVAYICLIFALDRFCDEKDVSSAILLGLAFAFHPVIGLWGIAAGIPAFFITRPNIFQTLKVVLITGVFSLVGVIPLLQMRTDSIEPTIENLKYFQLVKFPHHFDPFSWSRSEVVLVFVLMIFCAVIHLQLKNLKPSKFLFAFLTILAVFFTAGIAFRAFNVYELMKYTPTRLFAVFIPLFFLFYLSKAYQQDLLRKPLQIAMILPIILLSIWNAIPNRGFYQANSTYMAWNQNSDDMANGFIWLKNNTPQGALVIAPPWRYDFWYLSERAEIVNYRKPIISNIGEWQTRLDSLIGKANPENGYREDEELANFYFEINQATIESVAVKYNADYLISETDYAYPVVYLKNKVKIYRLSKVE